jgi:alkylhydroperoxidase family enzyme
VGRREGVSEQQLADLAAFEGSPAFSELEKRVLRYAVALTRTPADVPGELFNGLREHLDLLHDKGCWSYTSCTQGLLQLRTIPP